MAIDCNECKHFNSETNYCRYVKVRIPKSEIKSELHGCSHFNEPLKQDVAKDNVNHPAHYETGKFECIEVMIEALGVDAVKDFCLCNTFKYIYRCKRKNGVEDIEKANWYLNKFIELEKGKND